MHNLRNGTKWRFEPGLTRLRVRHSTTELQRSTSGIDRHDCFSSGGGTVDVCCICIRNVTYTANLNSPVFCILHLVCL